jgi:Cd2+/Zn2+-exporting ATPase
MDCAAKFDMSVLMTAAIMGAMAIGEWREGAVVAFLSSVSEMLESWTMERVRRSIGELMDIAPKMAWLRRPAGEVEVPVEDIQVGDVMIIRPGGKIAMDGRIIKRKVLTNDSLR